MKITYWIPASLMYIYNDLGFTDLEVSGRYKHGGFSKWIKFEKLMQNDYTDWSFYTDRTIADVEVVLDYDGFDCKHCLSMVHSTKCSECGTEYSIEERKERIQKYSDRLVNRLIKKGYKFKDYFSGSKGRHVHLIFPELRKMHDYKRKLWKQDFIRKYKGEGLKASKRVMILKEFANNPKTGGKKILLNERIGYNYLKGDEKSVKKTQEQEQEDKANDKFTEEFKEFGRFIGHTERSA